MISRLIDEDKKREEIVEECSNNCMIEAGAGAGKTTIIKNRVARQFKLGLLKPSQLVVITFTKAAAGELRDRISAVLEEAYKDTKDAEEKENLRNAIENQNLIQISTIHSFCFRLLEERALDIKLPLDVCMLEEYENEARINSFFKSWYREQDKDEILKLSKEFYLRDFSKYVYECFKEICDLPDDMKFRYYENLLDSIKLKDYVELMRQQTERIIDKVINVVKNVDKDVNTIAEAGKYLYADFVKYVGKVKSRILYQFIDVYNEISKKDIYFLSSLVDDEKGLKLFKSKELKAYNDSFNEILKNEKNYAIDLNMYQNALVLKLALKARHDYNIELSKGENRHYLSNDQLLKMSLELVKNKDALAHFQEEFKYIYVDEFQDTDTVQRDLVFKLAKKIDEDKFKDSSFFLVGDPKQSIYAFRGADLEVYKNTKNDLEKNEIDNVYVYELKRNHRSEDKIINWVNKEFKNSDYGLGDLYLEMTCKHSAPKNKDVLNGVYTLARAKANVPKELKVVKKDLLLRESKFLPKFIKTIIKDYKINCFDKFGNWTGTRNIEYKDFLVLTKSKKILENYADELKRSGIPVNLYGALDIENDGYVLRYKALIHYLTNIFDEKAMYGAEEVLMRSLITKENEMEAIKKLDDFTEICLGMRPYALIEYLAHHLEYFVDEYTNKAQMDYIQSSFQQLLEFLSSKGICSLSQYDDLIDNYIASGIDKSISLTKSENAVRLMNVHKSKGLEGKIVIVAGRFKDNNDKDESYRNMYDYYPSIKAGNMGKILPTYSKLDEALLKDEIPKKARSDEYIRLEYVEATRAEEALIFFDKNTNSSSIFDKFDYNDCVDLTQANEEIKDLYNQIMVNGEIEEEKEILKDVDDIELNNFDIKLNDEQLEYTFKNSSPSSYERYDDNWTVDIEERPSGKVFGTVLHRVFELACLLIKDGINIDKEEIINQAILESLNDIPKDDLEKYKEYLIIKLDEFLNSSLMNEIIKAKEIYPEYKFNFFVSDDMKKDLVGLDDGTLWLNGKVDLVLVFDDKIEIYDYKTDHKGKHDIESFEKHLEETYSSQQKLYCFALSKCFNIEIDKVKYHFYHLYNEE
ncbi:MAG: UvrD-helicase domain-containing protein [Bacilli bacterium]|nr:UvrD-helicase domain-containing protein [Bacilli bacterium]